MYDIVKVDAFQKVPGADLTRIGQLARAAMTAQTRQMLVRGLAWADFTFSFANGGYVVNVSVGDLWKEGAQYRTVSVTPVDLISLAPPSDGLKRKVALVAFANPARDDAPEDREFAKLITPATGTTPAVYQTETRQTTTLNRQIASIAKVQGELGPDPDAPVVAADQCVIAIVVLTRAGIESVTPNYATRAPNLGDVSARVDGVQAFVDGQGRRIDTLDKNLAALSARVPQPVSDALQRQILRNLAQLNEATRIKTGDLSFRTDYGLDDRYSDNTYAGYAATIDDGIRFPWVASKEVPITLYTPADPVAKVTAGLLQPDWTEEARLVVEGMDGSLSISSQVSQTITAVKVEIPRATLKTGEPFTVCSNSQFWADGRYDAATKIFTRQGETFIVGDVAYDAPNHFWARLTKTWVDLWTESRWDQVQTPVGLNGAIRYQTFRVPDFGYLSSIDLPFTTKDAALGVTLLLCETQNGVPNLNRVLERSDKAAGDITADAGGAVRTKFNFRPALVDPGKLYAWVTVTRGAYALATVKDNKFAEGTSGLTTDGGAFFAGDVLIDFAFTANFCRFKSPRVELRLNDVNNVNGDVISALKFLFGLVMPSGCRAVILAQRSGGDYLTVGEINPDGTLPTVLGAGPFGSAPLPQSVQVKIVFIGTTTLMPAIDLTQAWVTALKLGTTRYHVSTPINFGTNCNRGEVQVTVDGPFDPANHATLCKFIVAGATVDPSATSYADDPLKPGRRTYTYGFTFTTSTSARVALPGTLTSSLSAFHVENTFVRFWLV